MSGSEVRICVVDDDAAVDREPGVLGQRAFGRMPTAITTMSAGQHRAVLELDALDPPSRRRSLGVGLGHDLDAARLDRLLQQIAGGRIELALHQRRHEVDDGHVHALLLEPAAASRPSRPPPMTTRARRLRASSMA
jgi:hypothetical protein